ncbi:IPT/TIG domain-containing protein, partial [Flavobacterium solisilvae]
MKNNYTTVINKTFFSTTNQLLQLVERKFFAILIFSFLGFSNIAFSQLTNGCGDGAAGQIIVGTNCNFVNFNSNGNTDYWDGASGCNAGDYDDAWGWFDAISTTTTISYYSANDAIIHLFTGSCSTTMTALACADDFGNGGTETITYATTPGVRYRIRVQRYNSDNDMNGTICVTSPISDLCANATPLTVNTSCSTTNFNITNAFTDDGPAPCNGTSYKDGWYTFTTDADTYYVTAQGQSNDTKQFGLALYTGTCGALTQVSCTVPGANNANLTNISVLPNTTYLLRIMRTGGNNFMNGTICVFKSELTVPSSGNNSYTMCSGNLYDSGGTGNYANNSDGYTVIYPTAGNLVSVSGTINSRNGDYLTIYDGIGTGGNVLWGGSNHGNNNICTNYPVPTRTSTTGPLTVRFISNGNNTCAGFNLAISCVPAAPTITSFPSSACQGEEITIGGTNLANVTTVTIGGTPATITATTATSVTVIVGAGTTGTIFVNTPSSGSATSSGTITVIPTVGTPTAITVSSGTQPTCQLTNGTTTTTYTTTATNSTGFNWTLSNPAAGTINATTGEMTWANGFSGTVDIQVTANGCNGPSAQVVRTVTITPTVGTPTAITVSSGTEPTCQLPNGTTTTTYATTATNSTGFNWSLS